jgi:hypothetical protein
MPQIFVDRMQHTQHKIIKNGTDFGRQDATHQHK